MQHKVPTRIQTKPKHVRSKLKNGIQKQPRKNPNLDGDHDEETTAHDGGSGGSGDGDSHPAGGSDDRDPG